MHLVPFGAAGLAALARGDLAAAGAACGVRLTPFFVEDEWTSLWQLRAGQVEADPTTAGWLTCAVVAGEVPVGHAGYHGPPDAEGMVEIGYSVDPEHRRRGYAREAARALVARGRREPAVRTVRATISPANLASRALVAQLGFVEVGEQWDEEDGLETVFELDVSGPPEA